MIESLYHKIRRGLGRLDNYLLQHFPLLWSCNFIPFIGYNILLAWVFFMVNGSVEIAIFDMPDTRWIGMLFAVPAAGGLAGWLYFQTLLDAVYYHGGSRRFFSIKYVLLFFAVFLAVALSVALPYIGLNKQIVSTLTEPRLPAVHIDLTAGNPFDPQLDNPDSTAALHRRYAQLPAADRLGIHLSLGRLHFSKYPGLCFGRDKTGPWLRYLPAPHDTLLIYYNNALHTDTIHSYRFEMTIHTVQLKARVCSNQTKTPGDTTIGRFFFYSPSSRDTIVSDSGNIGLRCLTERICHCFAASGSYFRPDEKLPLISSVETDFFAAHNEVANARLTMWTAAFAACLLATLALFVYSFIRFFGSWLFFLGLTIPCSGGCFFSSDFVFRSGLRDNYHTLLWGLLALLAGFVFIRRRRTVSLMAFQAICYAIFAILILFPIEMPASPPHPPDHLPLPAIAIQSTPLLLGLAMLALFTFSTLFITKVCRLYERPAG
jgi:hypothetical protein